MQLCREDLIQEWNHWTRVWSLEVFLSQDRKTLAWKLSRRMLKHLKLFHRLLEAQNPLNSSNVCSMTDTRASRASEVCFHRVDNLGIHWLEDPREKAQNWSEQLYEHTWLLATADDSERSECLDMHSFYWWMSRSLHDERRQLSTV